MTEAQKFVSPHAQLKELFRTEPISLVQVTEQELPRFDKILTDLGQESSKAGMFPVTGNPQETNEEWVKNVKGLWLFGEKGVRFTDSSNVDGFVNVYAPEHMGKINDWLSSRGMNPYTHGALVELGSYVKDGPESEMREMSASKQALGKVFTDRNFRDVRAVTVWVTHDAQNTLDPNDVASMKELGGWPLGVHRYDPSESVDSTCFLITRRAYLDAVSGIKRS